MSASGRLPDHAEGETCAASAVHSHRPAPELCVRPDLPPPGDQTAGLRAKPCRTRGTGRVDDLDRASGARPDVYPERRVVIPGHDRRERHRCDLAVRITLLSQLGCGRGGEDDEPEHSRAGYCDQHPHSRDYRPGRACRQYASGDDALAWRFRGSTPRTRQPTRSGLRRSCDHFLYATRVMQGLETVPSLAPALSRPTEFSAPRRTAPSCWASAPRRRQPQAPPPRTSSSQRCPGWTSSSNSAR